MGHKTIPVTVFVPLCKLTQLSRYEDKFIYYTKIIFNGVLITK
jgi:hypothetical protein